MENNIKKTTKLHFDEIAENYNNSHDGRFVRLFDKLEPNPYYRAFNIV